MLNVSTLFLILFTFWMVISASANFIQPSFVILGLVSSMAIAITARRIRILNKNHPFLFLQVGFYKYLFGIINQNFFKNFKTAFEFIRKNPKINPVVDFILLDKDNDSEIALYATSLGLVPGVLCFSIKRRYIVVHLLDKDYFSLLDMYEASKAVSSVYDDSLV